jgi:MYXO-CTERM domain-containing protein
MILSNKLNKYVAALAVAGVGAAVQSANAAVVLSGPVNINIPSTTAGVYLNVVTGVNSTVPASAPGWDVNPWSSSGLALFSPTAPAGGAYVVAGTAGTTTTAVNLALGAPIGPSSNFGSGTSTAGAAQAIWNLNSDQNLIGFRFQNEANGNQIHFGWMRVALGATAGGQTRTIVAYGYEDQAGVAIGAGVPTPGAASLLGLAGLAGIRRRR